jgi:hypothetical protein
MVLSISTVLSHVRFTVSHLWRHALERRSQSGRVQWERMQRLIRRWLPPGPYLPSLSLAPFARHYLRQEPDAGNRLVRISSGGYGVIPIPTATPFPPTPKAAPFSNLAVSHQFAIGDVTNLGNVASSGYRSTKEDATFRPSSGK